jgi:uncharacterized membrane protein
MNDVPAEPVDRTFPLAAYEQMSRMLRIGLFTSLAVLIGALATYLVTHPAARSASAINSNPILQFLNVSGLVRGLAAGTPTAFLTLGLLILVATPIVRVGYGLYYFRRGGERTLAGITLTVLVLLLLGLLVIGPLVR